MAKKSKTQKNEDSITSEYSQEADHSGNESIEESKKVKKDDFDEEETRIILAKRTLEKARNEIKSKHGQLNQNDNNSNNNDSEKEDDINELNSFFQQNDLVKARKNKVLLFDKILKGLSKYKTEENTQFLFGHKRPITMCVFNPVTSDLVTVGKDGAILIFRKKLNYKRFVINPGYPKSETGHAGEILAIDISSDGKYIATGGKDRELKIWDLSKINDLFNLTQENKPVNHSLYLNPETSLKGHKGAITCIRFRYNSYECVTGSDDMTLKIWDVDQKGGMDTFYGHRATMTDITQISDRNFISSSCDKFPILWKLEKESQMIFQEQLFPIDSICALNQFIFVTGSQTGEVAIWNIAKKKFITKTEEFTNQGWVSSITTVYNSDFFIVGGLEDFVQIYKFESTKMGEINITKGPKIKTEGVISSMALTPDGKHLAIVESQENRFGRWTPRTNIKGKIRLVPLFN